ncbi:hypothetical protein SpCBS45565_g05938 [Spizellomyces sp. 'palustris']|nr:hypothetical protein SpCBS45565_g05938 [Spizellomyces sp. 'palustris']
MRHKGGTTGRSKFGSRSLENLSDKTAVSADQRIADLLLANNANLLALICQATFVGDTAASVSLGVLSLLRRQRERGTEAFLKRLLRSRIQGYLMKSRDLSDIIRDNSMATMLLNAFARYEGLHYLSQSLTEPLRDILPFIDGCEIDPQKFPPDMDQFTVQELLAENESRLKSACSRLLTSIVEKKEQMPVTLKRMCHFLRATVDEIYEGGWTPTFTVRHGGSKAEMSEPVGGSHLAEGETIMTSRSESRDSLKDKPRKERSAILTDSAEKLAPTETRRSQSFTRSQSLKDDMNPPPSKAEGFRLFGRRKHRGSTSSASNKEGEEDSTGPMRRTGSVELLHSSPISRRPSQGNKRSASKSHVRSGSTGQELGNFEKRQSQGRIKTHESMNSWPNGRKDSQPSLVADTSGSEVFRSRGLSERAFVPKLPSASRGSFASAKSVGYLSVSEKVVGSFLFLRFFVPAITAPDTYGLVEGKISPSARRGLVLCGKILTAMCNDVDFGNKEQYLMALNHFLRENREKIKDFLTFASLDEEFDQDENAGDVLEDVEVSRSGHLLSSNATSTHIHKALSRSMPSLKGPEPPRSADLKYPRTLSGDLVDTANFYIYLGKSLPKIERELEEQLCYLTPEESAGVLPNFFELKRVVEQSGYADSVQGERGKSKSQTLFARLSAKWGLKGFFQATNNKTRSHSLDDLAISAGAQARIPPSRIAFQSFNDAPLPPMSPPKLARNVLSHRDSASGRDWT